MMARAHPLGALQVDAAAVRKLSGTPVSTDTDMCMQITYVCVSVTGGEGAVRGTERRRGSRAAGGPLCALRVPA